MHIWSPYFWTIFPIPVISHTKCFVISLRFQQETYDTCIQEDNQTRKEAVLHFVEMAGKENLKYTIHHDRNISLNELISESSYADLLIIENKETMTFYAENPPTHFLKNLLQEIHCPVLVVPGEYRKINKVLFLYDGEPYSASAIKMFSYLFPDL